MYSVELPVWLKLSHWHWAKAITLSGCNCTLLTILHTLMGEGRGGGCPGQLTSFYSPIVMKLDFRHLSSNPTLPFCGTYSTSNNASLTFRNFCSMLFIKMNVAQTMVSIAGGLNPRPLIHELAALTTTPLPHSWSQHWKILPVNSSKSLSNKNGHPKTLFKIFYFYQTDLFQNKISLLMI